MTRGALAILTGPSGSGKTTLCRELAAAARSGGRDVAGVLCPAVFEGTCKTGIAVVDLRGGGTRALARRREPGPAEATARRRWVFDDAALAWGDARLAAATPCDLLVVDELGPLELDEGRGWTAGIAAIDSGAYHAAIVVVRPALLERARARWPLAAIADAAAPGTRARLAAWLDAGDDPR